MIRLRSVEKWHLERKKERKKELTKLVHRVAFAGCAEGPHSEVERSKVKVTRPLNAVTESQPYLRNGRHTNFKLGIGMEHDCPHHAP